MNIIINKFSRHLKKNIFRYIALLVYLLFTLFYMGPSITSCGTTVYGFGDNTAGPIWKETLPENQGLVGAYTSMTNAPFGDNLKSPIGYSLIGQTVLVRTTMAIAGPICGYNIANIIGFTLSAFIMFGFIFEVTRNKWIALLAGYAVSFAPYYQLKIGAHFAFGFQAIFIGIIWLFYRVSKYKKRRDAIILGLLLALSIYFDPYFTLLSAIVVMSLSLVWFLINKKIFRKSFWIEKNEGIETKKQIKLYSLALAICIVLIIPLVIIYFSQGRQINNAVAASRGNVLLEAKYCSTWPHEYLVPFVGNPIIKNIIGSDIYNTSVNVLRDNYSCGIGEDVIGVSIILFVIVVLGSSAMLWEKLNKRKLKLNEYLAFNPRLLIYGLFTIAVVGIILCFPPVKFHGIPSPSYVLIKITSIWRTLERIYVIINIALVALAAVFMTYFYNHFRLYTRKILSFILFIIIFSLVLIEYQTSPPFSGNRFGTFNYKESVPSQYAWLKSQNNIKTIAEYPLERSGGEGNSMAYYLTMQVTHKKKLFNGAVSSSFTENLKTGIKNLSDPQTLPVLKGMGVDAVVVHGVPVAEIMKIPDTKILFSAMPNGFSEVGFSPMLKNDEVNIVSLENVRPRNYIIAPADGFVRNLALTESVVNWQYGMLSGSTINLYSTSGQKGLNGNENVCFDIKMAQPKDVAILSLESDGKLVQHVLIDGNYKTVKLMAKNNIKLTNSINADMRLTKLGCVD